MPSYKLTYFDLKWLGEGIRLLLSYIGADWEDIRIMKLTRPETPWYKMKSDIKFGKVPYLDVDDKRLYQTGAICRYLASEAGLLGSNAWENAEIDAIYGSMTDLVKELQALFHETNQEAKAEREKLLMEKTLPYYLGIYDELVKENGYLANGKLSWADFYIIGAIESVGFFVDMDPFEKYPNLNALKEKIFAIPNVKVWIDRRPDGF